MKNNEIKKGKIKLKSGQEIRVTTIIDQGAGRLPRMRDKYGKPVDHRKHLSECYFAGANQTGTVKGGVDRINWYIKKVVKQHNRNMRQKRWEIRFNRIKLFFSFIGNRAAKTETKPI